MMNKHILLFLGLSFPLIGYEATAQNTQISIVKNLKYQQSVEPVFTDNYNYATIYSNKNRVYNLNGFELGKVKGKIIDLKVNPTGASYAVLTHHKEEYSVQVFDMFNENKQIKSITFATAPTKLCYTADARQLIVADQGNLLLYDTKTYNLKRRIKVSSGNNLTHLCTSQNGYFVAAATQNKVYLINQETGEIRKVWIQDAQVEDLEFSFDSSMLGILSSDKNTSIYDTQTLELKTVLKKPEVIAIFFHPDDKYIGLQTNSDIEFCNLNKKQDQPQLHLQESARDTRFIEDQKDNVYLTYNADKAVMYQKIKGLIPNYSKILLEELNNRLAEWSKMKPMESNETYMQRVTAQSIAQHKKLFAHDIATEMAGDLLTMESIRLGKYNPETQMLGLELGNLPMVYLNVPAEEVADFKDAGQLEFNDVRYGLTPEDDFEIVYANVKNKRNGKTYVFDNRDQQSLDFLKTDDNFVSLEVIQTASQEDVILQDIKNNIVDKEKKNNMLSNNTNIEVSTRVISSVNAKGERIENYMIDFRYSVKNDFSSRDDFAPGAFKTEDSKAAMLMLEIISQAFQGQFAEYLKTSKGVVITISGSADALPIRGRIAYDGCYGTFKDEPYHLKGRLNNMNLTTKEGIRTNEQLAFARAAGVRQQIEKIINIPQEMKARYEYNIELPDATGGEYRRIHVNFTFIDAF